MKLEDNKIVFNNFEDKKVEILLNAIFPDGYIVKEFKITEGKVHNYDGVVGYSSNPILFMILEYKNSNYKFVFKKDNYGPSGVIWYLYTDLKETKFTNVLACSKDVIIEYAKTLNTDNKLNKLKIIR